MLLANLNHLVRSGKATKAQVEELGKRTPSRGETNALLVQYSSGAVRKELLYKQRKQNLEAFHCKVRPLVYNLSF